MADDDLSIDEAYDILDLEEDASDEEINHAFRKKVKESHPDLNSQDDSKFKQVVKARDLLVSKKNEPDTISIVKKILEQSQKIDLKKTQFLEIKNDEIKKINNRFIRKILPRIGAGAITILVFNTFKEIQPFLEGIFSNSSNAPELISMMNLTMIIAIVGFIIFSVQNLLRLRSEEIDRIDNDYKTKLDELLKDEHFTDIK